MPFQTYFKKRNTMTSSDAEITVDPLTTKPTKAWEVLKNEQLVRSVAPLPLNTAIDPTAVRFVCLSDTHSCHSRLIYPIPPGDVFIHAGDFTKFGDPQEVRNFNSFLGTLPHSHKIVIAGNHELCFDPRYDSKGKKTGCSLLTNCSYLEDSLTTVYGIKIYGTPWQPWFCGWAFNLKRGESCLEKWNRIPSGIDVLVTHSPPLGHGDFCHSGVRAGCVELASTVRRRVKPKYHIFGHIHEGYGITTDGQTIFVNAATCNLSYLPVNPPVIFDIPLPEGISKNDHE